MFKNEFSIKLLFVSSYKDAVQGLCTKMFIVGGDALDQPSVRVPHSGALEGHFKNDPPRKVALRAALPSGSWRVTL